jgi:flagellar hook assembly protein FlgD
MGFFEIFLLSKPIAVNYLFRPTRGEKGSVTFTLSAASDVEISMYDRHGRKIATVADKLFPAGKNTVEWNGRDESGSVVAPGAYSGRIVAGKQAYWFKLIVTR